MLSIRAWLPKAVVRIPRYKPLSRSSWSRPLGAGPRPRASASAADSAAFASGTQQRPRTFSSSAPAPPPPAPPPATPSSPPSSPAAAAGEEGQVVDAPTVDELRLAAQLSRLSGIAYQPQEELDARLAQEGFQLVGSGTTHFTRWYVADGHLSGGGPAAAAAAARGTGEGQQPFAARVVLVRGVAWRSQELEVLRVWQDLSRCWPSPFLQRSTDPSARCSVVAHAGVAAMADQLYSGDLGRHAVDDRPEGLPLFIAGHSLGGALAVLLCCMARLKGGVPENDLAAFTFGSPPVLAAASGAAPGSQVLQALRLGRGSLQHYVLDNDPIPRAMLTADPSLALLRSAFPAAAAALLDLQRRLASAADQSLDLQRRLASAAEQGLEFFNSFSAAGSTSTTTTNSNSSASTSGGNTSALSSVSASVSTSSSLLLGPATPARFLFDVVGDVNLIRWSASSTHKVRRLSPGELDAQLELAVAEMVDQPAKALQALVDHHHAAYSAELMAAARHMSSRQQQQQ